MINFLKGMRVVTQKRVYLLFTYILCQSILIMFCVYFRHILKEDGFKEIRQSMKGIKQKKQSKPYTFHDPKSLKRCFFMSFRKIPSEKSDITKNEYKIEHKRKGNDTNIIDSFEIINGVYPRNYRHCNRFIQLESFRGRTGNQMFELASLLGIAYAYDLIPFISSDTILKQYFDLPIIYKNKYRKLCHSTKIACGTFAKVCNFSTKMSIQKGNITLQGFFQSWKYFHNIKDMINGLFRFRNTHLRRAREYLSMISISTYQTVCIHIRRGDLITSKRLSSGFDIPDVSFIENAKQFYIKRFKKVQFIVVSKDKQWCNQNIKNVNFSSFKDPGDDLALLSMCDHVVVTLGTFGWWGAWLSGGTVVYFDRIPRKGSKLELRMAREDYYPQHWVGIS